MAVTAQISAMQSREMMLANAAHIAELQHYIIGKMKEREADPREDMISDLVHAKVRNEDGSEERLTFDEAVSLVRATLIAGNDTTATAIGNLFYVLASKPEMAAVLDEAVTDERRLNRFVEEHLRIAPPVRALSRMTTREATVNGTVIPEGAHMLLVYESGNDDDSVFPDPRGFDIERPNLGRHVAFGGGPHRCIGVALARMEVKVAAREIARQMTNIRLAIAEDADPLSADRGDPHHRIAADHLRPARPGVTSGQLAGKVAVVTGGASGIGRAIAELFVAEGARVLIADLNAEAGEALAASLGDAAVFARADVGQPGDVGGLVVACDRTVQRARRDGQQRRDRLRAVPRLHRRHA